MLAFDKLPRPVRDFLNDARCDFPPVDVLHFWMQNGEQATIRALKAIEEQSFVV